MSGMLSVSSTFFPSDSSLIRHGQRNLASASYVSVPVHLLHY